MIRTRTIVAAAGVTLLSLGLLSCSSESADDSTPGEAGAAFGECEVTGTVGSIEIDPVQAGTLTTATELPNVGWWNGEDPESINGGFEYCLAANVAHRAGLDSVTVQNQSWDQLISGSSKNYDVGMASISVTEERKEVFDFSSSYFGSNLGVAIRAGDDVTEENIQSKKIGVLQGNLGAQFVTDTLKPEGGPVLFQASTDMYTALQAKQIDAVITDTTLTLTDVAGTGGELEVIAQYELDQNFAMIMPKGTPNQAAVSAAIDEMREDGTLDQLADQFLKPLFGVDPNTIQFWDVQ